MSMTIPTDQLFFATGPYGEGSGWTFLGTFQNKYDLWSIDSRSIKRLYIRWMQSGASFADEKEVDINSDGSFITPSSNCDHNMFAALREASIRYRLFKKGDPNFKQVDPSVSPNCR